ncbi:hypothetical protein [Methylomagnum sp.]
MKFEWRNGLIWVTVEIVYEGQHITINDCIVDTGSVSTAIDIERINFNYQKPASIRRLIGIGCGIQEVLSQRIDGFIIDGKTLADIDIEFGDIRNEFGINGFIGTNVLSKFNVSINFEAQTLQLF